VRCGAGEEVGDGRGAEDTGEKGKTYVVFTVAWLFTLAEVDCCTAKKKWKNKKDKTFLCFLFLFFFLFSPFFSSPLVWLT
jgi:hypothetical protein